MDTNHTTRRGSRRPAFTLLVFTMTMSSVVVVASFAIFFLWEIPLVMYNIMLALAALTLAASVYSMLRWYMQRYPRGHSYVADTIEKGLIIFLVLEEAADYVADRTCMKEHGEVLM